MGALDALPVQAKEKQDYKTGFELSEIADSSLYERVMKKHGKRLRKYFEKEGILEFAGDLCEYEGEYFRYNDLKIKLVKVHYTCIDDVDSRENPIEWGLKARIRVSYPNDRTVEYDIKFDVEEDFDRVGEEISKKKVYLVNLEEVF